MKKVYLRKNRCNANSKTARQAILDKGDILGYKVDFPASFPETNRIKVTFEIGFYPSIKEYDALVDAYNLAQKITLIIDKK